ncbi:MAG TPA: hypothetical protein VFY84_00905 [Jiangellales bacterium]|nr:hypothetical protein [Jiangellales bacterium]
MTTVDTTPTRPARSVIAPLYVGLALTVVSLLVLYVDHATENVLAGHIRSGYPSYDQARIDAAVTTYLIYLSVVGALGILSWLFAIRATSKGRRWARWFAATMFVVGTSVALFNLLVEDTSGDTGLPPLHGWVGLLPSMAGLAAVIMLRRTPGQKV